MYNQIIELGGSATVIVKAASSFGKYQENDVISILDNVFIDISYSSNEKIANQNVNTLLSYYTKNLSGLRIHNAGLTTELLEIFHESEEKTRCEVTDFYKAVCNKDSNSVYLKTTPKDSAEIRITPSVGFEYFARSNKINLNIENEELENYIISYPVDKEGYAINLEKQSNLPYVRLEIALSGNVDKSDGHTTLFIPYARFVEQPVLDNSNSNTTQYSLSLSVVKVEEDNEDENKYVTLFVW